MRHACICRMGWVGVSAGVMAHTASHSNTGVLGGSVRHACICRMGWVGVSAGVMAHTASHSNTRVYPTAHSINTLTACADVFEVLMSYHCIS